MTDRLRTVVWLALLALGIALSAVQLASNDHHHAHRAHAAHGHDHGNHHKPQRIFSWEPEQAHTLTLRAADGREQSFVRTGGEWRGPNSAAEENALEPSEYLALLSQARKDREFTPEAETLGSFGLEPALLQVRIEDGAGTVLADLAVGARTPDGFGRYVRVLMDGPVLIVPNYQFEAAIRALSLDI